jgi:hypothetical protein
VSSVSEQDISLIAWKGFKAFYIFNPRSLNVINSFCWKRNVTKRVRIYSDQQLHVNGVHNFCYNYPKQFKLWQFSKVTACGLEGRGLIPSHDLHNFYLRHHFRSALGRTSPTGTEIMPLAPPSFN